MAGIWDYLPSKGGGAWQSMGGGGAGFRSRIGSSILVKPPQTMQGTKKSGPVMKKGLPWGTKSRGEGDLYIRRVGDDAGRVYKERQGPNDIAITFDKKALLPDYMYYHLQSLFPKLNAMRQGTAQQAIKTIDVDNVILRSFSKRGTNE